MKPLSDFLLEDRPFLIAEAGVNHNGDVDRALRLVDEAAGAGADAVKFQTFRAGSLATSSAPKAGYQKEATGSGESQAEMLSRLELDRDAHRRIRGRCAQRGILFLSTPFDEGSADLLEELDVPMFKIGSGELTNIPFLEHVARKRRPVLLSTGMSTLNEVGRAVEAIRGAGDGDLALLHCVSSYPAPVADSNLRALRTMSDAFGLPVGYSDHTLGIEVSIAAAALGARIIEKHFTLDRSLPGPDHRASLEPAELKDLASALRGVGEALGDGVKAPRPCEEDARRVARRSIVLASDVPAGTRLTRELLAFKRPGTGISPARLSDVLGKTLAADQAAETMLGWEMLR